MGYQLVFWQQAPGVSLLAGAVYAGLMDQQPVTGLLKLPAEAIVVDLAAAFVAAIGPDDPPGTTFLELADGRGVLELDWSEQHLLVECRGVPDVEINRVIDVAFAHGCPLYDPQTNERFDAS